MIISRIISPTMANSLIISSFPSCVTQANSFSRYDLIVEKPVGDLLVPEVLVLETEHHM